MLEGMRRQANSFIMSMLFAIIILVFVFSFGPGSAESCGKALPVAAQVGKRPITAADFQQQYARTFDRMQQMRPNYTIETARAENLKNSVIEQLIARALLVLDAKHRGIVITDEELAEAIIGTPVFQKDGVFDRDLYHRYATSLNLSEAAFEDDFRDDLTAQRMREILLDTVAVSEVEIKELWTKRNDRADLWFVKVDPFAYKTKVEASDDEVKAFAAKERARIEDHYNTHATRYNKPEKVRARHILIKVADNASTADEAKARARIERAKQRVDAGEDFATVAKELSEDTSAAQGGDLGAQGRGAWVKPFEDAAFALEPGKVSDIVRTTFGFHLIKSERKIAAVERSVDDAALEIARELLLDDRAAAQAKAEAQQWLDKLAKADDPSSLNPPEKEGSQPDPFAAKVDSTGFFQRDTRYVPKVGIAQELVDAAFALSEDAPMGKEPIEVNKKYYVIKLKDRERPNPDTYADDRDRIKGELENKRRRSVVDDFIKHLRSRYTVEVNPSLVSYRSDDDANS